VRVGGLTSANARENLRQASQNTEMLDRSSSSEGGAGGALRAAFGRAGRGLRSPAAVLLGIALVWSATTLAALLWAWGADPQVFPSSDEAVVRYAAQLIGNHQGPFLNVPLPDPEDLLHPRSWLTIGSRATPSYAPVSFYVYGWLLRLPYGLGPLLVMAMPAVAVGAFAAGTARLLPRSRRWLGLAAPALGFPALYWVLRAWVNGSPLLIGICWSVFCWASWRESNRAGWLAASLASLGYAAAVRPDYAAYLFVVVLLLSVAASPAQWKLIAALVVGSGVLALSANLILNKQITGHALRAAYQMALDRQWGPADPKEHAAIGLLRSLLIPMGIPSWNVASTEFRKYWLTLGPIALLLFGQLALVPLLLEGSRLSRGLRAGAILVVVFFAISRLQDGVFGADLEQGEVHHSVPRYLAPVYLLAALPPILFVGRSRRAGIFIPGALLVAALAVGGCYEVGVRSMCSFSFLHRFVKSKEGMLARMSRKIPAEATVYTTYEDKWIWSRWRTWIIEEPEPSATSINRALDANIDLFIVEPSYNAKVKRLAAALRRRQISLIRVDRLGVYRVARMPKTGASLLPEPAAAPSPPAAASPPAAGSPPAAAAPE
jgi:hypothetical protein